MTIKKPPDQDSIFKIPEDEIDEDEQTIESCPWYIYLCPNPDCNKPVASVQIKCMKCGHVLNS